MAKIPKGVHKCFKFGKHWCKEVSTITSTLFKTIIYCYMCEVSLVVALALLQQCNSTTLAFP
jgi:hypothetical protein